MQLSIPAPLAQAFPGVTVVVPQELRRDALAPFQHQNDILEEHRNKFAQQHQPHYSTSQEWILKGAAGLRGEALILGIGNAADIPFKALAQQFEKVTIVEIDAVSIQRALGKLDDKELLKKITVIVADLTGCANPLDKEMKEIEEKYKTLQPAVRKLKENLPKIKPKVFTPLEGKKFDYVVSHLLLTQLASLPLLEIFNRLDRKFGHGSRNALHDQSIDSVTATFMRNIQTQHFRDLHKWTKKTGKVYFADTFEEIFLKCVTPEQPPQPTSQPKTMILKEVLQVADELFIDDKTFAKDIWVFEKVPPEQKPNAIGSRMNVMALLYSTKSLEKESSPNKIF